MTIGAMTPERNDCAMYTNDKNHRITLRLNDRQFAHVSDTAKLLGVSPSEFLRIIINLSIAAENHPDEMEQALNDIVAERTGNGRENDKTHIDGNI